MEEYMRRFCRNRLLALIRINGLLRNARRHMKANRPTRAKIFICEAKDVIDAFVEANNGSDS